MIGRLVMCALAVIGVIAVVVVCLTILENAEENSGLANLTYNKCCGGSPCTDTFYDRENDMCKLTLCHWPFKDCTYKPMET